MYRRVETRRFLKHVSAELAARLWQIHRQAGVKQFQIILFFLNKNIQGLTQQIYREIYSGNRMI